MKNTLREYLDFAVETAHLAGRTTLGYFRADFDTDYKEWDDTPVTIADRQAEEVIRRRIEKRYPSHAIWGEEFGDHRREESSHLWLIDPIDSTKSFIRGIPLFAVLIGLEIEGTSKVGAVYFPALDEMIYAAEGEGCFWNGRRTHVSATDSLDRSYVAFTDVNDFEVYHKAEAWDRLRKATYCRVGWPDAYGHALVATGRSEIMLDPIMDPWDCGPFPVILREAGGFFGDWSGKETSYAREALSTTQTLLPQVLKLIRGE